MPGSLLGRRLLLELQGHGDELLEVLDAGLVLRVGGGLQLGEVAGAFEHASRTVGRAGARLDDRAQLLQQRDEPLDGVRRAGGHAGRLVDAAQRRGEGDPLALRRARRCIASARSPMPRLGTLRIRRSGTVSVGVGQHPQVGQRVPDLLALVEAHAADDLVGQADPDEDLLEDTGLGVGAVEDGDVAGLGVARVGEPVDLLGDELRLVVLVVGDVADDQRAVAGVGPQVLRRGGRRCAR